MARILVVDDSATIRNYVELSVTPKGYEVVTAVDGQEGITKLEAEGPFDLLIVDLMMPNLNGF
ncbi:MAG: response regulator, partial [Myxococcota bacterium]